jgi:hypothetical protein
MGLFLGHVIGYTAVFFIWLHARRQPALDNTARKDYIGILGLNFLFCLASHFFYEYTRFDYSTWSVMRQPQDYSLFYALGVPKGDWLAIATAKYAVCSLVALVLFFFLILLNYFLLQRSKISEAKMRAIAVSLLCSICFLSTSAYGCYLFYREQTGA